jgi:hypothetical protein
MVSKLCCMLVGSSVAPAARPRPRFRVSFLLRLYVPGTESLQKHFYVNNVCAEVHRQLLGNMYLLPVQQEAHECRISCERIHWAQGFSALAPFTFTCVLP